MQSNETVARAVSPRHEDNTGFTLLEVLIAMAILAVGIMAVMQLFPASMRMSRAAAERTQAADVAGSQLSQLRALNNSGQIQAWLNQNASFTLSSAQAAYSLYTGWQTSAQQVSASENMLRVTFSVRMIDGRNETFVTYVTTP